MAKRKIRRGAKSQAVRAYMEQHPQASAAEVVSVLNEQGIKVSPAIVYNLRSIAKGTRRKSGRKRAIAARSANGARRLGRPRAALSAGISVEQLLGTKELAQQLGGTEALRRTLELLEKLQ
jgi:hypothetical protein